MNFNSFTTPLLTVLPKMRMICASEPDLRGYTPTPAWVTVVAVIVSLAVIARAREETITIKPQEDPEVVLQNPCMGWVLYENYPLDQRPGGSSTLLTLPNEKFEEADAVAIMAAWSDIEVARDRYDFSKLDHAYDYWKKRGKELHLRISTESLLWWSKLNPPSGLGVPDYVLKALPAEKIQKRISDGFEYTVVDARYRFYLDRLDRFLEAVSKHFSDDRPVALVDLRGFGLWGEWHSGFKYESLEARRDALKTIIDHWSRAFANQFLALSYSHDPDSPNDLYSGPTDRFDPKATRSYDAYLCYSAFDYAMTKPNMTLRRDGVGGAVFSNQRKLCEAFFHRGPPTGPFSSEFVTTYFEAKKGTPQWLEFLIEDALSLHPNYINLLGASGGDALAFTKEHPELVKRGLRKIGYRLVPLKATFPRTLKIGAKNNLTMDWINRGVGRTPFDCELQLLLKQDNDQVAQLNAGTLPTRNWIDGETFSVQKGFTLVDVGAGKYDLWLVLHDPQTHRAIELPIAGSTRQALRLGQVTVE